MSRRPPAHELDYPRAMELNDKVALITGASAGIGLAIARRLIDAGAHVVLVARDRERLGRAAAELGERAHPWPLDVGDLAALAQLPAQILARHRRLDVLVNNAGLHYRGEMLRHDPQRLEEMVRVNLSAPIVLTRAAAEHMGAGGVIVNIASLAGKLGVPGAAVYSGTKAGLRFWALAAAEELARRGLRIANVNPGPVDTGFFGDELEHATDLTFSQPMVDADQVAELALRCIHHPATALDRDIPYPSGKLATLGYLSPRLAKLLRPALERRGAKNKQKLLARRTGRV
jgi:short-subunit dehydrogenase